MAMFTGLPFSAAAKGSLWAEPRITVPPKPDPNSNPCGGRVRRVKGYGQGPAWGSAWG